MRQLNLSAREQKATLQALAHTTHPSAFRIIARSVENALRRQAHPNFIRWSICNGNPARVFFARALGVGNLTTLPGLIVAVEWPRERFAAIVGLVVAINQLTFAFGPSLVGIARDWSGGYGAALALCMGLQACAAGLILLGPGRR